MILLLAIIVLALVFDYTNGFHDTANAIATAVSTRAIPPRVAVLMAAILSFVGALVSTSVATTVGQGIVDTHLVTLPLVLAALVGAVVWNFVTWYFGLPVSTTQTITAAIMGTGSARRLSSVRWRWPATSPPPGCSHCPPPHWCRRASTSPAWPSCEPGRAGDGDPQRGRRRPVVRYTVPGATAERTPTLADPLTTRIECRSDEAGRDSMHQAHEGR